MPRKPTILSKWIESISEKFDSETPPDVDAMKNVLGEWFLAAQRLEAGAGDADLRANLGVALLINPSVSLINYQPS
jgi:hypothetical protein